MCARREHQQLLDFFSPGNLLDRRQKKNRKTQHGTDKKIYKKNKQTMRDGRKIE